jgi:beta-lactam-binding protein with PASTA domain
MPLEEELKRRVTKLELDLQEAQRLLVIRDADLSAKKEALAQKTDTVRQLQSQNKALKTDVETLHREIAALTSEKEQLAQKIAEFKAVRIKPTPTTLINSFRMAMDDLQESLKPKIGERVGYTVSQFDIDLKTAVTIDKDDKKVRFLLPEIGDQLPAENLSTVKFTFQTVPKVEPPDEDLVEVPALLGLSKKSAFQELSKRNLKTGTLTKQASDYPPDTIIGQNPDGGDLVPGNSAIDLIVARSPYVVVPLLVGKLQADAQQYLTELGLSFGKVERQENPAPEGTILSQDPEAETRLPDGGVIDIVIAQPERVLVPDLRGTLLDEAKTILHEKGLRSGPVTKVDSSEDQQGRVLEQNPEAGSRAPVQTEVSLVIGRAVRIKVPSVVRKSLDQAREILAASGLLTGRVTRRLHPQLDSVVLVQKPSAGKKVARGTAVDLVVAKKRLIREILESIKKHPDIRKTGFTYKTLAGRLEKAGIDSVEKFQHLAGLPDLEVAGVLKLRNQVEAPSFVKKIIRQVLEE